jgi:hypothetical protein
LEFDFPLFSDLSSYSFHFRKPQVVLKIEKKITATMIIVNLKNLQALKGI